MSNDAYTASPLNQQKRASTTESLAQAAHKAVDQTAEKAQAVEDELRDKASVASEKLSSAQAATAEQFSETVRQAEQFARAKPATAAGIAFAAGVLATVLLRR